MKKNSQKVSVIIPAYNEEKTIAGVIDVCLKTPEISEVIVVNDGSRDRTKEEAEKFLPKIKLINLERNRGKGFAVAKGIKAAKNDILLFLDADLINLEPHQISSLIWPVLQDRADMTLGPVISITKIRLFPADIISFCGQRCLKKNLVLPYLKEIAQSKYGLEILLNQIFEKKRVVVTPIISSQKIHLLKPEKQDDWIASYIREVWQVTQKAVRTKSKKYQEEVKKRLLKGLAKYFRISIERVREYLRE